MDFIIKIYKRLERKNIFLIYHQEIFEISLKKGQVVFTLG